MNQQELFYNNLLIYSGYLPTFIWLLPAILLFMKRKTINYSQKNLLQFCIWIFTFNVLVLLLIWSINNYLDFWKPILKYWSIENMLFTRILFHLNCFIFLGLCYFSLIPIKFLNSQKILLISLICILSMVHYFFVDGYQGYGTYGQNMYHIFIISITLTYLYFLFTKRLKYNLTNQPFFWISLGLLLPNAINLIFQFTAQSLYNDDFILYCKSYIITNIIEFISIGLIGLGTLKIK
jgi:hypothetical protein